jgi:predicted acyl esterase
VNIRKSVAFASLFVSLTASAAWSQNGDMVQTGSDIPAKWQKPTADYDYVKREVMIPMRDGVKLHTVIVIPKGAHDLPMLLERTPYDANFFAGKDSPHLRDVVWSANREWVDDGYIFVYQDIRGKYGKGTM